MHLHSFRCNQFYPKWFLIQNVSMKIYCFKLLDSCQTKYTDDLCISYVELIAGSWTNPRSKAGRDSQYRVRNRMLNSNHWIDLCRLVSNNSTVLSQVLVFAMNPETEPANYRSSDPSTPGIAVQIRNAGKSYGTTTAFERVNMTVPQGTVWAY